VVKTIPLVGLKKEEKEEVKRESLILEALNHPNITKFERQFKDKRNNYNIVMEYVNNGTLEDILVARKGSGIKLSEDQILNYLTQLCLALKHCHDRKILHRDIKGDNIFLNSRDIVKLGDFGVSKILAATKDKCGTMIGTPENMAPEVLNSKQYTSKCDIWSLGILVYRMTMLEAPW